ncbi:hypothetical protein JMJ56_24870 [Belnapia sp. T18]|uniref:Uncharacterized protein n=1 Tax=Belnapia arida TaxID=2804533 RepID=A0ABS1UC11_9PROT|nr:hypothetical protein [Belnapia arida]MBL6081232.1 hypothetical protein [Belnapia arida]
MAKNLQGDDDSGGPHRGVVQARLDAKSIDAVRRLTLILLFIGSWCAFQKLVAGAPTFPKVMLVVAAMSTLACAKTHGEVISPSSFGRWDEAAVLLLLAYSLEMLRVILP